MSWLKRILLALAGLWLANTSLFHSGFDDFKVIAHRGVHQSYVGPPPGEQTCTAAPIAPPEHSFIENTLASMTAAFEAGAEVVELDIHLTPDGAFAVFHDWTLECRTNGTGQTNQTSMADLKRLDAGFGYVTEAGDTPLRGTGVGAIPTLTEVFAAFPKGQFLINFKSNDPREAEALDQFLSADPARRASVFGTYGGPKPVAAFDTLRPDIPSFTKDGVRRCLLSYLGLGWTGYVPGSCQNTQVMVPQNYARLLWGWPHRFVDRMSDAGTDVILIGPFTRKGPTRGIDTREAAARIPAGFGGYVWTDDITALGMTIPDE